MPQETVNSAQSVHGTELERIYAQIELARRRSKNVKDGFKWFVNNVFSASFPRFITGQFIDDTCDHMQQHDWTMDVTARDHFKSTRLYAEIMYDIFTAEQNVEMVYFSYSMDMSRYHLKKIKQMIMDNPFFKIVTDNKRLSEGVLDYTNSQGANLTCTPSGLLIFKRGIHADRVYIDDPLKDPENKLAPTVIHKINDVMKLQIYAMVKKDGKCRVVGTPQTYSDFFFDEGLRERFDVVILDAMKDEANRIALFPEWKSFDELEAIRRTIGEKSFNQEYRAKPSYSEDSYITRNELMTCINPSLINQASYSGSHDVVAGYDIGKHTHPAHFSVFEMWEDKDGTHYKQLLSKWLDGWDYKKQLEYLTHAIELYKIDILRYDDTRGEFEGFKEQGLIPREMKPVHFSMKSKNAMAVSMQTAVLSGNLELINDTRQTDQILAVTSDLQAFESVEGHGDSFWSNALALWQEKQREYQIRVL
jgi:hypothetical protein|nr:MAG TPA: Terminase [Caudoviricetes sp.]